MRMDSLRFVYSVCIGLVFDCLSSDRRLYADQGARVKKKRMDSLRLWMSFMLLWRRMLEP